MAFVNTFTQKEDMQDDTFKILSQFVINAINAALEFDVPRLYSNLNIFRRTVAHKLKEDTHLKERLQTVKDLIYNRDLTADHETMSIAYDHLMDIYEDICRDLTKKGILFRIETDFDSIVAGTTKG